MTTGVRQAEAQAGSRPPEVEAALRDLARRLVWWLAPDAALADPRRFLPRHFDPEQLRRDTPLLLDGEVVQVAPDTLTVRIDGVRVSLFGVELGALDWPDVASDNGLPVASLRDLAATKLNALLGRAESRDYVDIAALPDAVKARLREAVLAVDRVPIVGTRSATVLPDEAR